MRPTLRIGPAAGAQRATVMPDDHSEVVPLLPIPNRTVKRLSADDSAGSRVKVGHRQALTAQTAQPLKRLGVLLWGRRAGANQQARAKVRMSAFRDQAVRDLLI